MAEVKATARGYYGGELREPGDVFEAEGKASWFEPVKGDDAEPFGGKGDHDGDGNPGGSPAGENATARRGGRKKAETVAAPTAEPFADPPPPEPVRVANEANEATGATQPDWVQG